MLGFYNLAPAARIECARHCGQEDREGLARIFKFTEWCFEQKELNQEVWSAAAGAFLEHLADHDQNAEIIPLRVKPEIFAEMQSEFKKRRERYGEGKFQKLLEKYNALNGTDFKG